MFDYYFATIFFAVLMMIILKILTIHNGLLERNVKKKLDIVATIIICASLAEWSGVKLDGAAGWTRPLHILVKMLELSLAPFIPVLCADIIGEVKWKKVIYRLLLVQAVLEILSGFTGFIFSVDEHNLYHHETFYWLYVAAFLFGIILFVVISLGQSMKQYGLRRILLLMLPFFALCGLFFQYFGNDTSEIRIIWLCVAIDVMLMYIMYLELTQNTDALTHLLNRRYYENQISRMRQAATVYYFDVNNFKHVNDTYGHSFGDVCLAAVGSCIQDAMGKKGTCYRIGGDEFCAILPIPVAEAEKYLKDFTMQMRIRREHMKELPYVSVGYAYFDPEKDNIVDTIKEADTMMYHYKRLSKEVGEEKILYGEYEEK